MRVLLLYCVEADTTADNNRPVNNIGSYGYLLL